MLITALTLALLAAGTAAALLTCFEKWGWLVWLAANRGRWWWLPTWAPTGCLFCLGFWISLGVAAALGAWAGAPPAAVLVAALPAGALARVLTGQILQQ